MSTFMLFIKTRKNLPACHFLISGVEICPEWMVVRKSDCRESYWSAQKTCEHPEQMLVGTVCGFSRCDCPEPTVLDTETGYCYDVDNCPTKHAE